MDQRPREGLLVVLPLLTASPNVQGPSISCLRGVPRKAAARVLTRQGRERCRRGCFVAGGTTAGTAIGNSPGSTLERHAAAALPTVPLRSGGGGFTTISRGRLRPGLRGDLVAAPSSATTAVAATAVSVSAATIVVSMRKAAAVAAAAAAAVAARSAEGCVAAAARGDCRFDLEDDGLGVAT